MLLDNPERRRVVNINTYDGSKIIHRLLNIYSFFYLTFHNLIMIYNSILIQLNLIILKDRLLCLLFPINRGLSENKAMLLLIRSVSAPLLSLLFLMMGS